MKQMLKDEDWKEHHFLRAKTGSWVTDFVGVQLIFRMLKKCSGLMESFNMVTLGEQIKAAFEKIECNKAIESAETEDVDVTLTDDTIPDDDGVESEGEPPKTKRKSSQSHSPAAKKAKFDMFTWWDKQTERIDRMIEVDIDIARNLSSGVTSLIKKQLLD
jgi:hypothetical protein